MILLTLLHKSYNIMSLSVAIFHLRETNVRQKIAQLIFSLHKDILFCQVVIPYKGQFKDLEYTIKCNILQLEKKKTNRQSQFVAIV